MHRIFSHSEYEHRIKASPPQPDSSHVTWLKLKLMSGRDGENQRQLTENHLSAMSSKTLDEMPKIGTD